MTPGLFGPTRRHKFLSLVDPELVEAPPWRSRGVLQYPVASARENVFPCSVRRAPEGSGDYPAATWNEAVALPFSPVEQDGLPAVTLGIPSGGQLDGANAVPTAVP
jgi:hypothetical protein